MILPVQPDTEYNGNFEVLYFLCLHMTAKRKENNRFVCSLFCRHSAAAAK